MPQSVVPTQYVLNSVPTAGGGVGALLTVTDAEAVPPAVVIVADHVPTTPNVLV